MFDNARQFLERHLPQPAEGKGFLNIHWSQPGTHGKRFWDGRACSSVDEAVKTLDWALKAGDKKDVYVAMSLQGRMEEKTSKRGYAYKKALRSANDAVALKSLFIDVDVKEGAYEDTREALSALKDFITSLGIPNPSGVVASGSGGFHAHWALDRELTRDQWQVLANALARATQELGLKCDSQCTIDSARILRVPDTFNNKGDEPKPVRLLSLGADVSYDDMVAALQPYIEALPVRTGERIAANDDLGAGVETKSAAPILLEEVAKACPFVARSLGTGGKENPNPLWFMTASIATFVEGGREALHKMSDQHPGYTVQATDDLYDRVLAKQKEKDLGWPKCSKIAGYGCKECQTCPLLAKNKSPLNFAAPAAAADDDALPEKFIRNPNGTISVRAVADDGTPITIPLTRYPVWKGWLSPGTWTLHFTTVLTPGAAPIQFEVPTEVIAAKDGLSKYLSAKGFFCSDKEAKYLKEFFMAWIQKLQQTKDRVISSNPFGWSVVDGKLEGFSYGGRVWMPKGDRPAANPDHVLAYQYSPKGDPAVWNELAKVVYGQNRPALNAILAASFAAPLVRFTGHPGLLLSAYSTESGIGKTTSMKCSQAVWAHPVMAAQGLDDTGNSVLKKMGQIKSLPVYWDEIKSEEQVKNFCSIVFTLTGGREKTRMNTDTTLRESGSWQTMMISASNESLIDPLIKKTGSTTAGIYRLFEYQVAKPTGPTGDVSAVQRLVSKIEDNYGWAGLAYAKFLGANFEKIEDEISDLQRELFAEVNATQDERMWIGTMTAVLKGAQYANQLGLTQINIDELKAFLIDTLEGMRAEIKKSPTDMNDELSLSTILAQFINSTRQNTLITNRTWLARGKPPKGAIQVLNDPTRIQRLGVHLSTEDKLLRISSSFFSQWMAENGHSRKVFLDRMGKEYGVEVKAGRLAGGTDLTSVLEHVVWIDMNHPKLAALIE